MFGYSLKLLASNWKKALKFFVYYIAIWGICIAMLLPLYFAFKDLASQCFSQATFAETVSGNFSGSVGQSIHRFFVNSYSFLLSSWHRNAGLVAYGLLVIFIFLPYLINLGKYAYCEMLYSYMTSKSKIGFFSAFVKGIKNSLLFSLCKTFYNLIFYAVLLFCVTKLGLIENQVYVNYVLPELLLVTMVFAFTFYQLSVMGWTSALIVFGSNVFSAYRKGLKAVNRHFLTFFLATFGCFLVFWLIVLFLGFYGLVALVPVVATFSCLYNMTNFFSSQGMRFYYNDNNILTPKRLEEVDKIKKTAFIL